MDGLGLVGRRWVAKVRKPKKSKGKERETVEEKRRGAWWPVLALQVVGGGLMDGFRYRLAWRRERDHALQWSLLRPLWPSVPDTSGWRTSFKIRFAEPTEWRIAHATLPL